MPSKINIVLPEFFRFNWLPKVNIEFNSNINTQKPYYPTQSYSSYGYSDFKKDQQQSLETEVNKKIEIIEKSKAMKRTIGNIRTKLLPAYRLYAEAYFKFPALAAGTDKIASYVLALKDYFVDKDGKEHPEVLVEFERRFGSLDSYKEKAAKQFTIFGQCIDNKFDTGSYHKDDRVKFRLISSSETSNYFINSDDISISSFQWTGGDVYNYTTIALYDDSGDLSFHVEKREDLEDLFIGDSKIASCLTKMDSVYKDDLNYQLFLKNSGYPVVIAMVAGEEISRMEIESVFKALRDPDQRFKVPVINNAAGPNGEPMVRFETFKPDIGQRLTPEEKREIDGAIFDCLQIPRKLMGFNTSGLGSNEYDTAMRDLKISAVDPMVRLIKNLGNSFRIPEGLKLMEKTNFFKDNNIQVTDLDGKNPHIATAEDFIWHIDELDVGDKEKKRFNLTESYRIGLFTAKEVKMQGWGYEVKDLLPDDDFRLLPSKSVPIEAGRLFTKEGQDKLNPGTVTSTDNSQKPNDGTNGTDKKPVPQKKTKEIIKEKAFKINSGKTKKKIKDFLGSSDQEYSKVPDLLQTKEAQDLKNDFVKALKEQYLSADYSKLIQTVKTKFEEKQKAENDDQAKADLLNIIKNSVKTLNSYLDVELLVSSLMYFAKLGRTEAIDLALKYQVELSDDEKNQITDLLNRFVESRTDNLLFGEPDNKDKELDIQGFSPYYDGNLNNTSYDAILAILLLVVPNNPTLSESELENMINEQISQSVDTRSEKLLEDNVIRSYLAGILFTGIKGKAKSYIWLPTKAEVPNEIHKAQWNTVSTLAEGWPSGDLPGERFGCQCGLKPVFKK